MDRKRAENDSVLSRRGFLAGTGGAGLLALSGCGGGSGSTSGGHSSGSSTEPQHKGVVKLSFWTWVPGIENAVDLFNKTHKGKIQVDLTKIPAGTGGNGGGYAKIYSALKAGNAPDLAQIEYQQIPSFLINKGLVDIKQYAQKHKAKFVDWQWGQCVFNNGVYAIPQASGPMGMFYREDLFDKWGITPPKTWDEYAKAAATIRKKSPNSYICTFPAGDSAWFTALAWQAGARWFSTSGNTWVLNVDSAATRKVASYWQDLVDKKLVKTENDTNNAFWKDVQQGNLATYIAASWDDALLRGNAPKTKGKWAVADMPQWGSGSFAASNWGGSSTAVMHGSKYPREATEFAVWLNTNKKSIDLLVTDGYGWPAIEDISGITSLTKNPKVFSFYGGQNINKVFTKADAHINENWGWIPLVDSVYNSLDDGFTSAVNGNGTFVDAVKKAQKHGISALKAKGLKASSG